MFTLLVSWLLVASIPGLLMLAAQGLWRLERSLTRDTAAAHDSAKFLEEAELTDPRVRPREEMWEMLDPWRRYRDRDCRETPLPELDVPRRHAEPAVATDRGSHIEASLPTRVRSHAQTNPQYTVTRHINRV